MQTKSTHSWYHLTALYKWRQSYFLQVRRWKTYYFPGIKIVLPEMKRSGSRKCEESPTAHHFHLLTIKLFFFQMPSQGEKTASYWAYSHDYNSHSNFLPWLTSEQGLTRLTSQLCELLKEVMVRDWQLPVWPSMLCLLMFTSRAYLPPPCWT